MEPTSVQMIAIHNQKGSVTWTVGKENVIRITISIIANLTLLKATVELTDSSLTTIYHNGEFTAMAITKKYD